LILNLKKLLNYLNEGDLPGKTWIMAVPYVGKTARLYLKSIFGFMPKVHLEAPSLMHILTELITKCQNMLNQHQNLISREHFCVHELGIKPIIKIFGLRLQHTQPKFPFLLHANKGSFISSFL
jgi:hypothetical protein